MAGWRRAGLLQPRQVTVLSLFFFVAAVAVTAVIAHLLGRWTRDVQTAQEFFNKECLV